MRGCEIGILAGIGLGLISPAVAERAAPTVAGEVAPVTNPQRPAVRIVPANPKSAPTTGTDLDGAHGYVCRTMLIRREDGGITKIRRCSD
jgi:hypothetical protein